MLALRQGQAELARSNNVTYIPINAMAVQVDIQDLQRELKSFQSELDGWTQKLVAECEHARVDHSSRIRELKSTPSGLK